MSSAGSAPGRIPFYGGPKALYISVYFEQSMIVFCLSCKEEDAIGSPTPGSSANDMRRRRHRFSTSSLEVSTSDESGRRFYRKKVGKILGDNIL